MRHFHRPLPFSILLVSLLFVCAPSEAKDLPIQGGPGGGYFRSECGAGQWVIGVTIRHGLWVDAMRLICAGYSSTSRVVPDFDLDFQGQQGGSLTPATVICSNDTYVTGIKFGTTWDGNDPKYVDYVEVTCASVVVFTGTPPFAVYGLIGTSTCLDTGEGCSNQPFSLSCDLGDAATGFHGRSGIYVDALGLICGPSPALVAATAQAPPAGTPPPPPQLTPDQIAYLNAHNERRAKHCAPKLTVSLELERAAKAWADACSYKHDESIRGSIGENIAWRRPTLTSTGAVKDWYDEISRYDFDHPINSYNAAVAGEADHPNTKEIRHFTQVVWKATTQLGCAMASCEAPAPDGADSVWQFFVCRYSPPGNIGATNPGVLDENVPRLSPEPCPK